MQLLAILDRLELAYMLGGSGASSTYGHARATNDLDFVIDLAEDQVPMLGGELGSRFYHDQEAIQSACRLKSSFNIIFVPSVYKFDFFLLTQDPFEQSQFARRRFRSIAWSGDQTIELAVSSPEDVILSKLRWQRKAGGSQIQRNDIAGILEIQRGHLDWPYLRQWAEYLGVQSDLDQLPT